MTNETIFSRFQKLESDVKENYAPLYGFKELKMQHSDKLKRNEELLETHGTYISSFEEQFDKTRERLSKKASIEQIDQIKDILKNCAQYDDLKDLYNKTVVPMEVHEAEFDEYRREHAQMREMIHQFDVNLALKSSKQDTAEVIKLLETRMSLNEFNKRERAI